MLNNNESLHLHFEFVTCLLQFDLIDYGSLSFSLSKKNVEQIYIYIFFQKDVEGHTRHSNKKHIQGHLYANTATSYGSTLFEHKPTSLKGGPKSIRERKTFTVEKYSYMSLKGDL